jgi:transcriptional regulator with GAF, ATPase, and Fis domain
MNKLEFFEGATLRICGSLEIEQALWKLLLYVRELIPVDRAVLRYHPPGENVVVQIARAELDRGHQEELLIPVPSQVSSAIEGQITGDAVLIPSTKDHPIASHTAHSVKALGSTVIAGPMSVEGQSIGVLLMAADRPGVLTPEHAQLLSPILQPCAVALSNALRYRELLKLKECLDEDYRSLREEIRQEAGEAIVGADFGLKASMEAVRLVAPQQSPVLLLGPTGTGKELLANAIHSFSTRRDKPFIKVNCGAIPDTLMDSELFGFEKGAFTGALQRKRGKLERAHGGTIFLDEVAELSPSAQTRLLRVLQNGEIERVGGTETLTLDIRVIAATHRDLSSMVDEGVFRSDLFYRLNVFPVAVPSLAERKADIPALVHHFMHKKSRRLGLSGVPTMEPRAMERLLAYDWPGNVRELENAVERELILCRGNPLTFMNVDPARPTRDPESAERSTVAFECLDDMVRRHIGRALKRADGRVAGTGGAAELLEIHPQTLRHRMKKLGIPFGRTEKNQNPRTARQ